METAKYKLKKLRLTKFLVWCKLYVSKLAKKKGTQKNQCQQAWEAIGTLMR